MNGSRRILSTYLMLGSLFVPAALADGPAKDLLDLQTTLSKRLTPQWGSEDQVRSRLPARIRPLQAW